MLTELEARCLECPLLSGKVKVIPRYQCEASDCPEWKRMESSLDKPGKKYGDCYWLKRAREEGND